MCHLPCQVVGAPLIILPPFFFHPHLSTIACPASTMFFPVHYVMLLCQVSWASLSLPLIPFVRGELLPANSSSPHLMVFSSLLCLFSSSVFLLSCLPHISLNTVLPSQPWPPSSPPTLLRLLSSSSSLPPLLPSSHLS